MQTTEQKDYKEQKKTQKEQALRDWNEKKIQIAKRWIDEEKKQNSRKIVQSGVYFCDLGENIGSEQNTNLDEPRPVLVVSNSFINKSGSNVIIVPLSKHLIIKKGRKGKIVPKYSSHYFLKKDKYTFLRYDSAVKTEEVRSVSKIRLLGKLGEINEQDFNNILIRLKWTFRGY